MELTVEKSWLQRHSWLLARRCSQLSILGLFLLGPVAGIWILKGNLNSSLLLDTVPMTEPLVFLQVIAARHWPEFSLLLGVAIISLLYGLLGGRVYCSWVCPLNIVTDSAGWLRRRLDLRKSRKLPQSLRRWVLAIILLFPLLTGIVIWELVNPVAMLHRGLIYGMGAGWLLILAVFILDTFYVKNGFCGHICPQGVLYGMIGHFSPLKVVAQERASCNDCMDCYAVCPEPQVLKPVLKGRELPTIFDSDCTKCGRCLDVCSKDVFQFKSRFASKTER